MARAPPRCLLPSSQRTAAHVSVFQRTPIWLLPKLDAPLPEHARASIPTPARRAAAGAPAHSRRHRACDGVAIVYHGSPAAVRAIEALCLAHLRIQVREPSRGKRLRAR